MEKIIREIVRKSKSVQNCDFLEEQDKVSYWIKLTAEEKNKWDIISKELIKLHKYGVDFILDTRESQDLRNLKIIINKLDKKEMK